MSNQGTDALIQMIMTKMAQVEELTGKEFSRINPEIESEIFQAIDSRNTFNLIQSIEILDTMINYFK
jgi:hypothetical protein